MGKTFSVDVEALNNGSKELADISENYSRISAQLMDKASTMGAAWDAEDNLAFVSQITGFCDEMKTMAGKLKQSSEILASQAKNYQTHLEDNISQVRKLKN